MAEWREFSRYALACILMHAVKQSLRVSGGFSGGLLPVLPVSRQKRPEAVLAVRARDVMVNENLKRIFFNG